MTEIGSLHHLVAYNREMIIKNDSLGSFTRVSGEKEKSKISHFSRKGREIIYMT